jgi:predicted acylesterase/phospholipase RssA
MMTTYDLVFEGGGAKGMAFVGALQEFEARGFTFDRLLGTSTGAITAALLAAGYSAQEMFAALNERANGQPVFASFLSTPRPFSLEEARTSAVYRLLRNFDLPFVPGYVQESWGDRVVQSILDQPVVHHVLSFVERGGWYAADRFLDWLAHKLDEGPFAGLRRRFS